MNGAARDTIVAVATAPGRAGIGIVRLSGPAVPALARALLGRLPRPRRASHLRVAAADGSVIDDVLALYFAAPRSYTGEPVLELHAHGNPLLLAALTERCVALGARRARPGEFTERAFCEGRIDLARAEAVADLIAASSAAQLRAARRSLDGEFSQRVEAVLERLTQLRVQVEAAIDFADEAIDHLSDQRIAAELAALRATLAALLDAARRGQRLRDGLHAVLLGPPNAGKSSLLNALAGRERAIVTPIAGTTRDVLCEAIAIDGVELTLADTAGLRASDDPVEAEGVRRAEAELARADLALLVLDAAAAAPEFDAAARSLAAATAAAPARLWLLNKADRPGAARGLPAALAGADAVLVVSALTGEGLPALRAALAARAGADSGEGAFSARARHVEALERVAAALARGAEHIERYRAGELLAEELRLAQDALGEITGRLLPDALLGRIFASFCIGK